MGMALGDGPGGAGVLALEGHGWLKWRIGPCSVPCHTGACERMRSGGAQLTRSYHACIRVVSHPRALHGLMMAKFCLQL